jgi:hypothetical protein
MVIRYSFTARWAIECRRDSINRVNSFTRVGESASLLALQQAHDDRCVFAEQALLVQGQVAGGTRWLGIEVVPDEEVLDREEAARMDKRMLSGKEKIANYAEHKEIACKISGFATSLFRRHEACVASAPLVSCALPGCVAGALNNLRDAKVPNLW